MSGVNKYDPEKYEYLVKKFVDNPGELTEIEQLLIQTFEQDPEFQNSLQAYQTATKIIEVFQENDAIQDLDLTPPTDEEIAAFKKFLGLNSSDDTTNKEE